VTRFAFIDVQRATYGVSVLCRVLGVSRSGFYAWAGRPPSSHEVSDAVLTEQVRTAFTSNRSVYGAPRVHAELAADGVRAGRKRVARLMRGAGLVGCHRRKRSFSVTRQDPAAAAAPDLVERSFTATAPNQLWVADVTYVPTVVGWLYLACVTDVFSRMIVGWSMASHRKTELVVDAVTMAVGRRGGHVPGVIHHSDRGAEGGFRGSSQHLGLEGVVDGEEEGTAFGFDRSAAVALARASAGEWAAGAAAVLGADLAGCVQRGCGERVRRVDAGGLAVVSRGWRHAAVDVGTAV